MPPIASDTGKKGHALLAIIVYWVRFRFTWKSVIYWRVRMIKHSNTILTQPAFRISLNLNPLWWLLWKLHKTHQLIVIIITFYLLFFSIKSSTSGKPCITKNWYIKKNKNITSMESMLWPEWFCFLSISFTNRVQSPTTFISQNIITFRHTLIVCCPAIS